MHDHMGHPGQFRTLTFIRQFYTWPGIDKDVANFIKDCRICAIEKPRFYHPPVGRLIHAKRPWERISIDFVGPKSSQKGKRWILTVVDEFSRFPFAFEVADMTPATVAGCLESLFTIFGPPGCVHSDRGRQFESSEFVGFLARWRVRKTRTAPYNPSCNGQCERINGILWNTIKLRLRQLELPITQWPEQLNFALMNMRTLVCRSTGETPHSRFFAFDRHSTVLQLLIMRLGIWLSQNGYRQNRMLYSGVTCVRRKTRLWTKSELKR